MTTANGVGRRDRLSAFLAQQGYLVGKSGEALEEALIKALGRRRFERFCEVANGLDDGASRSEELYACLRSRKEAHTLFSQQWEEALLIGTWLAEVVAASARAGDAVADLGCATGAWAAFVATEHPELQVVGLDRASHFIEMARAGRPPKNCRFEAWDFSSDALPESGSFGVLASALGVDLDGGINHCECAVTSDGLMTSETFTRYEARLRPCFASWRRVARDGARLAICLRLSLMDGLLAAVQAAATEGWRLQPESCRVFATGDQCFYGLVFDASPADSASVDVPAVAQAVIGAWGDQPVSEEGTRTSGGALAWSRLMLMTGRTVDLSERRRHPRGLELHRTTGRHAGGIYILAAVSSGPVLLRELPADRAAQAQEEYAHAFP